ncbi:MAG TPA: hypothetical protein VL574_13890 [Stellaceae bacterium]|nr:hypothetical protein [Stellaceae bacterium]
MADSENYRGFLVNLEERPSGLGWKAVISSDDPALIELIADGGIATLDGPDRQHAQRQARRFIDTLLEPHIERVEHFQIGQVWINDGVEGEVVETRLNGLEARLRIDGEVGDWQALDPREGSWTPRRPS